MDRRLKLSLLALPLAAAGAACAWFLLPAVSPAVLPTVVPTREEVVAHAPPAIVEHCRRAAELLYEVNWAAACFKMNGDNDCTLPDAQAARVNAILDTEEKRCMAAETFASARQ